MVVYFSQTGTTKKLAGVLKQAVNADEIELRLVTPYPSTYDSAIAAVGAQRESKQWPALENAKLDLAKYDTVYLGYPIMFGSFAPPIYTFLDSNDLSGKVVVPFCTFGSGGRKVSAAELKTLEPGANVTLAMGVSNKRMSRDDGDSIAKVEVETFLANLAAGKTDEMLMGGGGGNGCSSNMAGGLIDTDNGFEITGGVLLAFGDYSTDTPNCASVSFANDKFYGSDNAAFKPEYHGNIIFYGGDVKSVAEVNVSGMKEFKFPNGKVYMYK